MLNPRADLVGALLDFDLSVVTCAYDGTTVRITPRAAHSFQTLSCTVTPYTMEEKRNRGRIVKYFERGFTPFIIDPNCDHDTQCENCTTVITRKPPVAKPDLIKGGEYRAKRLVGYDRMREVYNAQYDSDGICVCGHDGYTPYSLALIEENEHDAINFLAEYYNWSDEMISEAKAVPRIQRQICLDCRWDGGTFDSALVRESARITQQAVHTLESQSLMEKVRYAIAHKGSIDGYQQRFTHGEKLDKVFDDAEGLILPGSSRPPVGLNPERFLSKCTSCGEWLHGCEFGVEFCSKCDKETKPPAKKAKQGK
ncbi:MAG: hypothetical protein SGARI_001357 [Bacillariaceae sp.]